MTIKRIDDIRNGTGVEREEPTEDANLGDWDLIDGVVFRKCPAPENPIGNMPDFHMICGPDGKVTVIED
jgi:hypothetical protein